MDKKAREIIAQMPRVNELEKVLEVQEEDKELALLSQDMRKAVSGARGKILKANQEIQTRFGQMPETEKILTEK